MFASNGSYFVIFSIFASLITGRNVAAKVMFLHVSVILFTGGVSGQAPPAGRPPKDQAGPPPRTMQTHPRQGEPPPDQADTPPPRQGEPPRPGRPPRQGEPPHRTRQTPPREEDCSIRSMSGRYASYWNAFLFVKWCCDVITTKLKSQCSRRYLEGVHYILTPKANSTLC